ncbi:MAG: hypothetical protein Q9N34_07445 [Aquificota bacterium]|nr:hypothetical protein [Aquificota bacterium]
MSDEGYMSLALSLAKRRKGLTHPNPTVGCVIVKDGEIVGLGYHERAGYPTCGGCSPLSRLERRQRAPQPT